MATHHVRDFFNSRTTQLAATYLGVIMFMSLGFSVALYNTSSQQLSRQLPPDSLYHTDRPGHDLSDYGSRDQVSQFLEDRIEQGRDALLVRLLYLNLGALVLGSLFSYVLARRSLEPIEESMEAQAQFVNDASHELRTPLAAIQISNEVFLRRAKPSLADAKKLIEQNTEDVKRLQQLSDGLLNLAKHGQPAINLQPVELQTITAEAVAQILPQANDKSITISNKVSDVEAQADPSTLIQAFVILLDNAVKYSPNGKNVVLSSRTRGKYTYLDVTDEGVGIRPTDIPHLFRRFYRADASRTKGSQTGYGLGLAIAKQIVENQHGDIEVVSEPGKGSTFSIKLLKT